MKGNQADNREKAIAHLEAALTVFHKDTHPDQWAQAQNNLAIAYSAACAAIVPTIRRRPSRRSRLRSAYSRATRAPAMGAGAAQLAVVCSSRMQGDREAQPPEGDRGFEAALTVFTRDGSPLDHLRSHGCSAACCSRRATSGGGAAHRQRARGVPAAVRTRRFGSGGAALLADAGPLFADAAFAALQRRETEKALELANEGRARLLAVAMKLQTIDLPRRSTRRLDELRRCHPRRTRGRRRRARNGSRRRHRPADRPAPRAVHARRSAAAAAQR